MRLGLLIGLFGVLFAAATSSAQPRTPLVPTPADVKPGSITCEDVPYPFPVSYLPLTLSGQDVRIAFMDVPPLGPDQRAMARNTRLILDSLKIDKAMIVGHSMGGMLAARFATQYPDIYQRTLASTYPSIRASIMRYVAHNEAA